ncbi:MAG: flagellar protein FlbB [Alphaproteobacteria bacterium]|nr:flagellar protein FlbB [Alphaproteobacteria bacterium]
MNRAALNLKPKRKRSDWAYHLRVMPLLVIVAALSFGIRFGEFVTGVSSMPGSAQAESPVEVAQPDLPDKDAQAMIDQESGELHDMTDGDETTELGEGPKITASNSVKNAKEWRDSSDTDFEFSEMRMELFEDLAARRQALEEQSRELEVREALLKAAEQELNQKYKELISLRSEIQDLLKEQSEEEKARTASLVKIYEGMKPKDAARIFNTLDLDILLSVVSQMSERKSAPIIASMDPARARTLTMMLMEQKSLPKISEGFIQ